MSPLVTGLLNLLEIQFLKMKSKEQGRLATFNLVNC